MIRTSILFLTAALGFGATVYTVPTGLAPGTHYQLVFVTLDASFATSSTISTYNTFVSTEAALNATLAAFDTANSVTWTVIGSTTTVNATANAPSSGLVYTLNNVEVAASGLYGGSLLSPINIDQNADAITTTVWTGSNSAGTAAGGINDLGQTFPEYGSDTSTTSSWIAGTNGVFSNNSQALYALSSVLTVPLTSTVPEPGTAALILVSLTGFGLRTALRRKV